MSPSLLVGKLAGHPRQNHLFVALREARTLPRGEYAADEIVLYHRALKELAPQLLALAPQLKKINSMPSVVAASRTTLRSL